jgi:RNA-directed DNA polymerase
LEALVLFVARLLPAVRGVRLPRAEARMYNDKLLIKPSCKSVKALVRNVWKVIKVNKPTPAGQLIGQRHPLVRGWAYDCRQVVSKASFAKMDHAILQALWHWAKRRYPNKLPGWMRRKYFTRVAYNC